MVAHGFNCFIGVVEVSPFFKCKGLVTTPTVKKLQSILAMSATMGAHAARDKDQVGIEHDTVDFRRCFPRRFGSAAPSRRLGIQ
jgi:hypothetical protein